MITLLSAPVFGQIRNDGAVMKENESVRIDSKFAYVGDGKTDAREDSFIFSVYWGVDHQEDITVMAKLNHKKQGPQLKVRVRKSTYIKPLKQLQVTKNVTYVFVFPNPVGREL